MRTHRSPGHGGSRSVRLRTAVALGSCALGLVAFMAEVRGNEGPWQPLRADSVHDPRAPAVRVLQEPAQALGEIAKRAPDTAGNRVRWVKAIEEKHIQPLASLFNPGFSIQVLDLDVYLDLGGSMPVVRFPHRAHTLWLDCKNCHDHIFAAKVGVNKIAMYEILQGNQCGICHGAVAFPLTECQRCHSVPQKDFEEMYRARGLPPNSVISIPVGREIPGFLKK